jgi:hypothetical protein
MIELVSKLFDGIQIKRRFLTSSYNYRQSYDFYTLLRFSLNLSSNEEIRGYLISKNLGEIEVCRSELIPSFMKELLILGLISQAEKAGNKIKNQCTDFIDLYSKYENFEIKSLAGHPLTHGLYNKLISIKNTVSESYKKESIDLIDTIASMRVESVDKIVLMVRDHSVKVAHMDKL